MALWTSTLWLRDIERVDHGELGSARLIAQYRGDQVRIQAWLDAFLVELDRAEDVGYSFLTDIWPHTAVGVTLDYLGEIVGQPRLGLVDDAYRLMLLGRIYVNTGDGQCPQFAELAGILYLDDPLFYDEAPGAARIDVAGCDYPMPVSTLFDDLAPAGVSLLFVYSTYPADETYTCQSVHDPQPLSATMGAGTVHDATVGGRLSGSLRR